MCSAIRHLPLIVSIVLTVGAQGSPEDKPVKHIDRYLTAWAEMGRFSGNVLLAKNGKIVFRKSYGMANLDQGVPNRQDTVFRIGSMTKPFTALAVLQLEERGLLKLEDPLVGYLPETPGAWRAVTLHHLLTHTSGVPDISKVSAYHDYGDPLRIERALETLADAPLQFEPGSRFAYSNSGYMLLGRVIEKVSGKKYEEYLVENVFRPSGMVNSGLGRAGLALKHGAAGYVVGDGKLVNAIDDDMMGPFSAGGLYSTVDDLLRFDQALYTEKLLKRAAIEKAMAPQVRCVFPPPFDDPNAFYSHGWVVSNVGGHKSVSHGGWVSGFISEFTRYPDDRSVMIVLGNIEAPHMAVITRKVNRILWGGSYELPHRRTAMKLEARTLEPVAGRYEIAPGMALVFTLGKDGRMFVNQEGQPVRLEVQAESESSFFIVDLPTTISFERDPAGKVTAALVNMDGKEVRALRVK